MFNKSRNNWKNEGNREQQNWNRQSNQNSNPRDPRLQQPPPPLPQLQSPNFYLYKQKVLESSLPFLEEVAQVRYGRGFSQICSLLPYELDIICAKNLQNFVKEVFEHKFVNVSLENNNRSKDERANYQRNAIVMQQNHNMNVESQHQQQQSFKKSQENPAIVNSNYPKLKISRAYQVKSNVFQNIDEVFSKTQTNWQQREEQSTTSNQAVTNESPFIDIASLGREKTAAELRKDREQRQKYRKGFSGTSGWEEYSNAKGTKYSSTKFQAVPLEPPTYVSLTSSSNSNPKDSSSNSKRNTPLEVNKGTGLQVVKAKRYKNHSQPKIKVEPDEAANDSDDTIIEG